MAATYSVYMVPKTADLQEAVCAICEDKVTEGQQHAIIHERGTGLSYFAHERCAKNRLDIEDL